VSAGTDPRGEGRTPDHRHLHRKRHIPRGLTQRITTNDAQGGVRARTPAAARVATQDPDLDLDLGLDRHVREGVLDRTIGVVNVTRKIARTKKRHMSVGTAIGARSARSTSRKSEIQSNRIPTLSVLRIR